MRMTSRSLPPADDAASARSRATVMALGGPVSDERPVEPGESYRVRRRAGHDDPVIGCRRARLQVRYPLATLEPYTSDRELALEARGFVRPALLRAS
jgi:hypothetical protein